MTAFDTIHWSAESGGRLRLRTIPLPVAPARDVRETVPHLDAAGTLRVPPPGDVRHGVAYGPDSGWTGSMAGLPPAPEGEGWEGLRVLVRSRLLAMGGLLAVPDGVWTRRPEAPLRLPCAWLSVNPDGETAAGAEVVRVSAEVGLAARTTAELDRLSDAARAILSGVMAGAGWELRGFRLAGTSDREDGAVRERVLSFRFNARRQ